MFDFSECDDSVRVAPRVSYVASTVRFCSGGCRGCGFFSSSQKLRAFCFFVRFLSVLVRQRAFLSGSDWQRILHQSLGVAVSRF